MLTPLSDQIQRHADAVCQGYITLCPSCTLWHRTSERDTSALSIASLVSHTFVYNCTLLGQ